MTSRRRMRLSDRPARRARVRRRLLSRAPVVCHQRGQCRARAGTAEPTVRLPSPGRSFPTLTSVKPCPGIPLSPRSPFCSSGRYRQSGEHVRRCDRWCHRRVARLALPRGGRGDPSSQVESMAHPSQGQALQVVPRALDQVPESLRAEADRVAASLDGETRQRVDAWLDAVRARTERQRQAAQTR